MSLNTVKNTVIISDMNKLHPSCLDWCKEANQPTRKIWQEILEGQHPDRTRQIFETEYFFDLPAEQLNWWENHVQNHPFVAIFAWENYQKLKAERQT